MSDQLVSPQDTYLRLISEANDSRRKRSLEAINEACRLLHERHSSDFSYKTIIAWQRPRAAGSRRKVHRQQDRRALPGTDPGMETLVAAQGQ